MNFNRKWVTSFTAGSFLLSAVTGVLVFFHLDSGSNKFFHEWLSWALLIGAALHLSTNFNAFKKYCAIRSNQLTIAAFVAILAISFIPTGKDSKPPFFSSVKALSNAPLTTLSEVAKISPEDLQQRLAKNGYSVPSNPKKLTDIVGNDLGGQMRALNIIFNSPAI